MGFLYEFISNTKLAVCSNDSSITNSSHGLNQTNVKSEDIKSSFSFQKTQYSEATVLQQPLPYTYLITTKHKKKRRKK